MSLQQQWHRHRHQHSQLSVRFVEHTSSHGEVSLATPVSTCGSLVWHCQKAAELPLVSSTSSSGREMAASQNSKQILQQMGWRCLETHPSRSPGIFQNLRIQVRSVHRQRVLQNLQRDQKNWCTLSCRHPLLVLHWLSREQAKAAAHLQRTKLQPNHCGHRLKLMPPSD